MPHLSGRFSRPGPTPIPAQTTPLRSTLEPKFSKCRDFGTGSGSGQVRVGIIRCPRWRFPNRLARTNSYFRIIKEIKFRDRIGSSPDQENAKIIPLQIFNLLVQLPSVRLSVNQWVPGSSPGRGADPSFKFNQLRLFSSRDP